MELRRFTSPHDYQAATTAFLEAYEAENNLILGLTNTLITNPMRYPDPAYMATIEDRGDVVMVVLRTPPYNLLLGHPVREDALPLLLDDVHAEYGTLPGLQGPKPHVEVCANLWREKAGQDFVLNRAMRIYKLEQVKPVSGVPGMLRPATANDYELAVAWLVGFSIDIGDTPDEDGLRQSMSRRLTGEDSGLFIWEVDGQPVSMVGYSGPTPHGIRINAVYTPPEHRRHGYASACTAAVSQWLLDGGRQFCFLFTDLANPTSNHIYQEIGYVPVVDVDQYDFMMP